MGAFTIFSGFLVACLLVSALIHYQAGHKVWQITRLTRIFFTAHLAKTLLP